MIQREGLPPMVLVPAKNYDMTIGDDVEITLPKEGNLNKINPYIFIDDEPFSLAQDVNDELMISTSVLSKVLFATKQYPELGDNELFVVTAIFIGDDTVTIVGNVVKFHSRDKLFMQYFKRPPTIN